MGIEEVVNWEVDVSVQSTGLNTSDVQILLSSPSVQYLSSKEASWSVLLIEKGLNLQLYKVVCIPSGIEKNARKSKNQKIDHYYETCFDESVDDNENDTCNKLITRSAIMYINIL